MRTIRPGLLVMLYVLVVQTAGAQTRPGPATLVQGIVVEWGTATPIAKATVELRRVEAGAAPYVAMTAADGTFGFGSVE